MKAYIVLLFLAILSQPCVEGDSTINPMSNDKDINEKSPTPLDSDKYNENIAQKVQYLEMQRQLQGTLIENLEHKLKIINNDYETRQKLLLASINLLVEEKHEEIFDQIKSGYDCECTGRTGPPGPKGDKGYPGEMGYRGYQGRRGLNGLPGNKGMKGNKGIDYST